MRVLNVFTNPTNQILVYFIKSGTVQMVIKEYNNFPFMYVEQGNNHIHQSLI